MYCNRNATLNNTKVVICDAWYGFPSQRRPRKERVLAVSRQICNFLSWRRRNKEECNRTSISVANTTTPKMTMMTDCVLYVIGKDDDVSTIQERVDKIVRDEWKGGSIDDDDTCQCQFLHGVTLEQLSTRIQFTRSRSHVHDDHIHLPHTETPNAEPNASNNNDNIDNNNIDNNNIDNNTTHHQHLSPHSTPQKHQSFNLTTIIPTNEDIIYLSPDADETLDPHSPPPSILVIGMLVDRRVQPDRSKKRAAQSIARLSQRSSPPTTPPNNTTTTCTHHPNKPAERCTQGTEEGKHTAPVHDGTPASLTIRCARLPLDALNVSDLGTDEALNIDTVMEMLQRWWDNYYARTVYSTEVAAGSSGVEGCRGNEDGVCGTGGVAVLRGCFTDAAARSMLTHRTRHPNRTIHGGATNSPHHKAT